MELKLDSLIDKIKAQGIEEGRKNEQNIISQAEQEARGIVARAKEDAKNILDNAKQESEKLLLSGKDGLKQAERDLLLSLETKLKDLGNKYVEAGIVEALGTERLIDILKKALSSWTFASDENIFVHLSSEDAKIITKETISGVLKANNNLEIKVDSSIGSGFRISQGSSGYAFDFTSTAISEALAVFLTPNIQELLK